MHAPLEYSSPAPQPPPLKSEKLPLIPRFAVSELLLDEEEELTSVQAELDAEAEAPPPPMDHVDEMLDEELDVS